MEERSNMATSRNNLTEPVCVFSTNENVPSVKGVKLEEILFGHDPALRKLKVAVISIAGKPRKGKSFLMNLILRYLESNLDSSFLENPDETFDGFDWKHCRDAVTKGVQIWPKAFKVRCPNGEEMAVILMDTQGIYDNTLTTKDSFNIFTFDTLVSSTIIFNVDQDIHGDDLGKLKLFIDYGRMLKSDMDRKHKADSEHPSTPSAPFQNLIFLIRDWSFVEEFDYGWQGGQQLLDKLLMSNNLPNELLEQRSSIAEAFETTKAFLMPEPGKIMKGKSEFQRKVRDMDNEFVSCMKLFVKQLIDPITLIPKTVSGRNITLEGFCGLIDSYSTRFMEEDLTPEDLGQHILNAAKAAIIRECINRYKEHMQENLKHNPESFNGQIHRDAEVNALNCLKDSPFSDEGNMDESLKEKIDDVRQHLADLNRALYQDSLKAELQTTYMLCQEYDEEIKHLQNKCKEVAQKLKDREDFIINAIAIASGAGALLAGGALMIGKMYFR